MKKDTHPANNRPVIFEDKEAGARFLILSTVETEEKGKWEDGTEYDLYPVEISSASHPFYTGNEKVLDTAGRVDKFKKRMEASKAKKS
jgi:large subunit ribosomal protein L31